MSLVVVTGGARSGKSRVAQRLAEQRGSDVVVVTFGRGGDADTEMADRIARHKAERPGHWRTIEPEEPWGWLGEVDAAEILLLDCLGTLVGRLMEEAYAVLDLEKTFRDVEEVPAGFERSVERSLSPVLQGLLTRRGDTIVVTNEVGSGLVPAWALGRLFRDLLGRANRALIDAADASYLVVSGRCVELSALPQDVGWPADEAAEAGRVG